MNKKKKLLLVVLALVIVSLTLIIWACTSPEVYHAPGVWDDPYSKYDSCAFSN